MFLIKEVSIVNEGKITVGDVLIKGDKIEKIGKNLSVDGKCTEIDGEGLHLFPGVIDDQVHFREPGLTHKGNIFTESRAAVAGGVTSYMEMPNVNPQTITQELLAAKYEIGAANSLANYSFYMGSTNSNLDEVLKTDPASVCGIKIFMGSSTGNMLVDDPQTLENIFCNAPILIATHCEDEDTIRRNTAEYAERFGDDIPFRYHPIIRNEEACYLSSSKAKEPPVDDYAFINEASVSDAADEEEDELRRGDEAKPRGDESTLVGSSSSSSSANMDAAASEDDDEDSPPPAEHSVRPGEKVSAEPIDESFLDRMLTRLSNGFDAIFSKTF